MVAISLYRGNLHKVPDVPRRWLMPNHKITLKDFKSLLHKREKTLSRLRSTIITTTSTTTATTSNPNPNPKPNSNAEQQQPNDFVGDNDCSKQNNTLTIIEPPQRDDVASGSKLKIERLDGDAKDQSGGSGGDVRVETQLKGVGNSLPIPDPKSAAQQNVCEVKDAADGAGASEVVKEEKLLVLAGRTVEISNNVEREKKKKEIEENLKVLNERKHNLVQMLKQILTAEEEIKRRNTIQTSLIRPPVVVVPQQAAENTTMDSKPRQIVSSSPSRFAPPLLPLSVSGTHYTASSPSPAGSGGTSVFRDSRITSPSWN